MSCAPTFSVNLPSSGNFTSYLLNSGLYSSTIPISSFIIKSICFPPANLPNYAVWTNESNEIFMDDDGNILLVEM